MEGLVEALLVVVLVGVDFVKQVDLDQTVEGAPVACLYCPETLARSGSYLAACVCTGH